MKCYHCGQEIENGAATCIYCGANQGAGATVVLDQVFNPYAAESENGRTDPLEEQIRSCSQAQDYGAQDYGTQNYGAQNYGAQNYGQQPQIPNPKFTQAQKYAGYSQNQGYAGGRPLLQLPTGRGLAKMFFLGLLTFGIYDIVIYSKIVTELNIAASRSDGRRTMPFTAVPYLGMLTFGIYIFVWWHQFCERIGMELNRRGCGYKFGASDFWLWNLLGALIVVGPFVFLHKLMKAMNLINEDFNLNG